MRGRLFLVPDSEAGLYTLTPHPYLLIRLICSSLNHQYLGFHGVCFPVAAARAVWNFPSHLELKIISHISDELKLFLVIYIPLLLVCCDVCQMTLAFYAIALNHLELS